MEPCSNVAQHCEPALHPRAMPHARGAVGLGGNTTRLGGAPPTVHAIWLGLAWWGPWECCNSQLGVLDNPPSQQMGQNRARVSLHASPTNQWMADIADHRNWLLALAGAPHNKLSQSKLLVANKAPSQSAQWVPGLGCRHSLGTWAPDSTLQELQPATCFRPELVLEPELCIANPKAWTWALGPVHSPRPPASQPSTL